MIEIYTTFDSKYDTWNIVNNLNNKTLFYGNIEEVEEELIKNKTKYKLKKEIKNEK